MKPLISCIIPTHNGERYLGQAIESLLAQTWQPIEIIVVDDGSTDSSREIAAAFGNPVRVVRQRFANPVMARNYGMTLAAGEFFAFLDQDDLWIPEKLTLQMAALDEEEALDVCVGMVQRFTQASPKDEMTMVGPAVSGYLTVAMLARRRAFARVGALDPAHFYSDSAEWFLRARACGIGVRMLPQTLVYHRDHDSNRSLTHGDCSRNEFLHLLKSKLDRQRGLG